MNKVETKKHWYDKPIKFLFFFLTLFPIFLLLGNYISCQLVLNNTITTTTNQFDANTNTETQQNLVNGDGDLTNIQGYLELGYRTPFDTALTYTNLTLSGMNEVYANEDNLKTWGEYLIPTATLPILTKLQTWYFSIILDNGSTFNDNVGNQDQFSMPTTTMAIWSLWEIQLAFYYIILRVILFLPNVICYLLDWVERRLGKL